jgi:ribosomal protein S18 acetylase RimI-like enzyme
MARTRTIPLEVVGLMHGRLHAALAEQLLIEVAGRAVSLGASGTELALTKLWQPCRGIAERLGYRRLYSDLDMICPDPDWGPDRTIPKGWHWENAVPDWVEEYTRVLYSGFANTPGAFLPGPAEVRRYLVQPHIGARVLFDEDGRGTALLRYTPREFYINAVARDAVQRGRGLGPLIMDEARRRLLHAHCSAAMRLTVVDTNTAAMDLYRRCNFEVEKMVAVLVRRLT